MGKKILRAILFFILTSINFFAFFSGYVFRNEVNPYLKAADSSPRNFAIREDDDIHLSRNVPRKTVSILLPDWEVLVISSPDDSDSKDQYYCLFRNNITTPAKFTGTLPISHRSTFKCNLPHRLHRHHFFPQPILTRTPEIQQNSSSVELYRWGFLAYESLSTESDLIVFAKGVNNHLGNSRPLGELGCVFGNDDGNYTVKTDVISSTQEVFRCQHPDETELHSLGYGKIRVSIEISGKKPLIVPSVAYYTGPPVVDGEEKKKSLLCACTMVHNVAKYLKEWVMYNANIGVDKFILYDNDSQDELQKVVQELGEQQYDVKTFLWPWPKAQEAGFSHCAMLARDQCTWMMYMDIDEFVFSPSWVNSSSPSRHMIPSLLPNTSSSVLSSWSSDKDTPKVGQVWIKCLEFGPSNQTSHPVAGVTQGYTCRRLMDNKHKSILLLSAIDPSLNNVIHHFRLKDGYTESTLNLGVAVINHYKYQAWSEFEKKFRRRVSAYVVDWTRKVNPQSGDRAPGLGFEPIEPEDWANKFCEVQDTKLNMVTRRWFGLKDESSGNKMAWQD